MIRSNYPAAERQSLFHTSEAENRNKPRGDGRIKRPYRANIVSAERNHRDFFGETMFFYKRNRFLFGTFLLKLNYESATPPEILKHLLKSRNPLPTTRVKRFKLVKRFPRNGSLTVRGPVNFTVVNDDQTAVTTFSHVKFYCTRSHF